MLLAVRHCLPLGLLLLLLLLVMVLVMMMLMLMLGCRPLLAAGLLLGQGSAGVVASWSW